MFPSELGLVWSSDTSSRPRSFNYKGKKREGETLQFSDIYLPSESWSLLWWMRKFRRGEPLTSKLQKMKSCSSSSDSPLPPPPHPSENFNMGFTAETEDSTKHDRCRRRGSTQSFQPRRDSPQKLVCGPVAVAGALHDDERLDVISCLGLPGPPQPLEDNGNHAVHNSSSNLPAG